jgi:hypothetical protein
MSGLHSLLGLEPKRLLTLRSAAGNLPTGSNKGTHWLLTLKP